MQQPYLLILSTISTHAPYYFPDSINFNGNANARAAYHYADNELGKFIRFFDDSPLFEDRLLLITVDTATGWCPLFGKDSEYGRMIHSQKVPLLFYYQGLKHPVIIDIPGAHYDIAPTLLNILGIEYQASFIGKNLFEKEGLTGRAILFNRSSYRGLLQGSCIHYHQMHSLLAIK